MCVCGGGGGGGGVQNNFAIAAFPESALIQ